MRVLLLCVACLVLAACAPKPAPALPPISKTPTPAESAPAADDPGALKVMRFLGKERATALALAVRGTSFRLEPDTQVKERFDQYTTTAQGADLTKAQVEEVRRLVFDARSYVWDAAKGCMVRPGVVLRLYGKEPEAKPVDLVLCFECDIWQFFGHGKRNGHNCDPARGALLKIVKPLFPDDAVIQGLKE